MSTVSVLAPLPGTVLDLQEVPDPVFAQAMVGPGLAIEPPRDAQRITVTAPITGTVVKAMPHAFVIMHESGNAVLVHVGIDTVHLKGEGFTVSVAKGDMLQAGDPVVECDVAFIRSRDLSACCPVVVLDAQADQLTDLHASGASVTSGDVLFRVL
ncbi:PTS glucose transporter subunit IIA [Kocuria carniphila]|uniref:PTS glucose transporter subunit IIA n=1 Tax=Kocuria carniphila TaxID=262208 RepID=A0ABV3V5N5_9MICC|nr:PTS glucose transporter subunit IIA [Kocuria carniphila]PZP33758.1 MAG: PTS glucose transporter subunit IIA [Kocuria rhizophila]